MRRLITLWTACCFVFASTVWPLAAFAAVPDVGGPFSPYPPYSNPYLQQPGTYVNTATGADVTREVSRVVDGTVVKIAVKDSMSRAAIARAFARGASVLCGGWVGMIGCAAVGEYAIEQGIKACEQYGYCKTDPTYTDTRGCAGSASGYPFWFVATQAIGSIQPNACVYGPTPYGPCGSYSAKGCFQSGYASKPPDPNPPQVASPPPNEDPGFIPWLTDWQGNSSRPGPAVDTRSPGLAQQSADGGYHADDPTFEPGTPTTATSPPTTGQPTTTTTHGTNSAGQPTTTTTTTTPTVTTGQTGSTVSNTTITNNITTTTTTTVVNDTTGAVESSNTTTTTGPAPDDGPKECGSPNHPKCAIDETGTPTDATVPFTEPKQAQDDIQKSITDAVTAEGANGEALEQKTKWTFFFTLPSGCTSIPVFLGVVVDPCQYSDMIHDLMSMVWSIGTVIGIIEAHGRSFGEST